MLSLTSDNKALKLTTPHAAALSDKIQIPHAKYPGLLALPYRHDTIKYLRNMGLTLSNWHPIEKVYPFPKVKMVYEMFPHAKTTAQKAIQFERGFILNDPRTAKTSSIISMCNYLRYYEDPGACLIIAPLSTITEGNVWPEEIKGMTPGAKVSFLFGRNLSGRNRIKHCKKVLKQKQDYYIINPDGIKIAELHELLMHAIETKRITKMVIDESTEFGNDQTARWKAAQKLSAPLRWFWMATGTPGDPMTVYGQAKMMNPSNPAIPSSKEVWKLRTMYQLTETKWVPKATADEHIYAALTPAWRVKKRDVWPDMPPELIIPVRAELDGPTAQIIQHLKNDKAVSVKGNEMIPANGGVMALRMIQIANGIFKVTQGKDDGSDTPKDEYIRLPIKQKLESLLHLLRQTESRTVIYTTYKETFEYLKDELEKHWADLAKTRKYRVATVNGTVAPTKRGPIFNAFNSDPEGPDILIAHPLTVSYGVELAAMCDTLIFFGVPFIKPFLVQQAKERLFSSAQRSTCPTIYQLYSLPQELRGFKALEDGIDFSTSMADLFKDE